MAARPVSGITADTDVNLDFLTKEEKEALLSKKMDIIRQRNKALTERHKLIEADKKKAEDAGQAVKPTVDSQTLPAEGAPKSRGRGRGQPHNKDGNRPARERPKSSGDFRDSFNYEPIIDTTDLANYRSKGHGGPYERDAPNNTPKNKKKPSKEEATAFSSNFEYEPIIDMKDLDKRFGPLLNPLDVWSQSHTDHGPPPDPSFNPLADRRRNDKKEDASDHRRHPRNYGGSTDLFRVKQNMKNLREKERERPQGNKPLELVMTGKERKNHEEWKAERERYDKERLQRQLSDAGNWKRAWDADKIYQENDEQSASYSSKVEPAKRPAGRIGSGRFDRGEREDRPRSAVIGKGALQHTELLQQQQQRQHHHDQQQLQPQLHQHHSLVGENKVPRGRGRGRGRGRSRGSVSGEKFPRPRTWSGGDDRFVECQKELLLVKFDNTAGDNSVEVEYDDDEFLPSPPSASPPKTPQSATTPRRGPTGRTPNQAPKEQSHGGKQQQQKNRSPRHKDKPQVDTQLTPTEDKWNAPATPETTLDQAIAACDIKEANVRTSNHSQSYGDSEEWEDCTESSGMHEDDDFGISGVGLSDTITDISNHELHMECRLNPEAPEFLPSSPDLTKTPSELATIIAWAANNIQSSPLSQDSETSPQPLSQGLSLSPQTHPITHSQGFSATTVQSGEKTDIVPKNDQPSQLSHVDLSTSQKIPETAQVNGGNDLSAQIPKSVDKYAEIKDVRTSCLTSHGTGNRDSMSALKTVGKANAASDASNKPSEEGADNSKAVSPQEETISGHISAFAVKGLVQTSSLDESKDTSKESATSLVTETTQDSAVAKDLCKEVPIIQDPAEGSSKPVNVYAGINGNGSTKHMLNEESTVFNDHTLATFSAIGDTIQSHKEECVKQVVCTVPAEKVAAKVSGPSDSSETSVPAGSQSSPREDESAPPTADISAFS